MLDPNPLKIGNFLFPNNLIQGPLAGVSCAPFRALTWRYSRPAFTYTEMISCKTLIHQPSFSLNRYIHKAPEEGPVCFQLSGNNANDVGLATKIVTEYGADLVDLNCGCPVKKIRRQDAGSKLLTVPQKLYALSLAMKKNTHVPVGIKIRVDGGSGDNFNSEIAKIVNETGLDFLVVHGRHWTDGYDTACHYEDIQYFVENVKVPVIGNGDIESLPGLHKMQATGCAGTMISRAGVGQPWLIGKLLSEQFNKTYLVPTHSEIGEIFFEHVLNLATLLKSEKFSLLQARKFGKYYARSLAYKSEFCLALNQCSTLKELKLLCDKFFC